MRDVMLGDHLAVEGAAGVAVAGYRAELRRQPSLADKQCVLVLCGGNASADTIRLVLGEAS
jgi:threonine dehydratase